MTYIPDLLSWVPYCALQKLLSNLFLSRLDRREECGLSVYISLSSLVKIDDISRKKKKVDFKTRNQDLLTVKKWDIYLCVQVDTVN